MKFSELNLHPVLQANLDKIQFVDCTPIQEQAIPLLRVGKDLSGLAQTGTGKTGAFLIPLIDRLLKASKPEAVVTESPTVPFNEWKKRHFVLVLVPTRELCEQVQDNARKFLENTGMSSVAVYGGTTYEKQVSALKQGVEFVIATPGRFIDLYKEHVADLGLVRAVIFDEADRMFDMGFKDDMKFILRRIPRERQFLVFSATLNFEVLNVAYENGADPVEINISRDSAKAENVKDCIIHLGHTDKPRYLLSLLRKNEPRQAIIFSNFKHNVERIARFLTSNNVPAMGISSLLTQGQRNRVMAQFRAENEKNILVATDVAARGLDILGVDMVINYDLPEDAENYVHRIGRTGRAGQTGKAFSLVGDRDVESLQRIEEFLGHKVDAEWIEETDLVKDFSPLPRDEDRHQRPAHRDRPPRREGQRDTRGGGGRGPRPERGPRPAGGPPGQHRPENKPSDQSRHRDRHSGRHRDGQAAQGQSQQARGQGQGQAHGGRPHGQHQGQGHQRKDQHPQRGGHQSQNRQGNRPQRGPNSGGQHQGQRPRHAAGGHRPAHARPSKTPQGIGKKVSGFLKRLFGKES